MFSIWRHSSIRKLSYNFRMSRDFKRMKLCSQQMNDNSYFDSYADIAVHEEMLCDENRTNAYKKAIFGCANELKNKVFKANLYFSFIFNADQTNQTKTFELVKLIISFVVFSI